MLRCPHCGRPVEAPRRMWFGNYGQPVTVRCSRLWFPHKVRIVAHFTPR